MAEELTKQLNELAGILVDKQKEVYEKFSPEELKAYFRARDSLRVLIPNLNDLENALYANKIVLMREG